MTNIYTPPEKVHFLTHVNTLTVPDALLAYIERGKSVIPLQSHGERAKAPQPLAWKEFQSRVATPDEARRWLDRWPDMAIGFVTGAINGLNVLDCDAPMAERWLQKHVPYTRLTQRTRRGLHRFYRCGELRVPTVKNLGPGDIDARGEGGYVVIAPSVIAGHRYTWKWGLSAPRVQVPTLDALGEGFFMGSGGAPGGNHGTHLQGQVYGPDGLIIDGREAYLTSLIMGVVATFMRRYRLLPEPADTAAEAWNEFQKRCDLTDEKYTYGLCLEKAVYAVRRVADGSVTISDDDDTEGNEEGYEKWGR